METWIKVTRKSGHATWINAQAIDTLTVMDRTTMVRLRSLDSFEIRESPQEVFNEIKTAMERA
jgi:uncharacterized protein YlzI (FlbEa/FlbD family)